MDDREDASEIVVDISRFWNPFWIFGVVFALYSGSMWVWLFRTKWLGIESVLFLCFVVPVWVLWMFFSGRRRLRIGAEAVSLEARLGSFAVRLADITRLSAPLPRFITVFVVETRGGTQFQFSVARARRHGEFCDALDEIARRARKNWVGWSRAAETREKFRAGTAIAALREATGTHGRADLFIWILRHAIMIDYAEIGVRNSLVEWGSTLPLIGMLIAAGASQAGSQSDGERIVSLGLVLIAWALVMLGGSLLLAVGKTEVRRRERLAAEIAAAREVQRKLLPSGQPVFAGFDLAGVCLAAEDVGGDYFDYIRFGRGKLAVTVADVSGKGLSAGLLMTLTKGALTSALAQGLGAAKTVSVVNGCIRESAEKHMFVTMALAELESEKSRIVLARAGHNPPLLIRAGKETPEWLSPDGLALGLRASQVFDEVCRTLELELEPGDVLVLYTDGVTEAMNQNRDEYGEERLAKIVLGNSSRPAAEIQAAILEDVAGFRGATPVNDDLTLVVIRAAVTVPSGSPSA